MHVIFYLKFLLLSFLVLGIAGCSDWRAQEADDLTKYLELRPFVAELGAFRKGRHHLDYGVLEAEFDFPTKDFDILDRLDHIASEEGWRIFDAGDNRRILSRPYRERESGFDQISFQIENDERIVMIWRKSSGSMPASAERRESSLEESRLEPNGGDGGEEEKNGD